MNNHTFLHLRVFIVCCLIVVGGQALQSCNKNKPIEPIAAVPIIIYDTDLGSSTDDLFGLEMLYNYHNQGRCRLLGVVVDRMGEDCAACADVMNTYVGHGELPIGLVKDGIENPAMWIDCSGGRLRIILRCLMDGNSTAACWLLSLTTR